MQKCIILGQSLMNKLQSIDHPIAEFILKCAEEKEQLDVDFSYFDFIKDEGKISFLKNRWEGDGKEFDSSRRETMKIGRLIIALSQKKNMTFHDKEIEDFVNKYKIFQQDSHFEIFKGKNIPKWYNESKYDKSGEANASLYNSCMRHKECKDYFSIYEKHPNVSLLCLLSADKKLQGRAILWENITLDGEKIFFLDRIYTYKYSAEAIFKDYAIKNGWWFKNKQSNSCHIITNGIKDISDFELRTHLPKNVEWDSVSKPYMDTMKFVKEDVVNGDIIEYLSSNGDDQNYKQYWTQTSGNHNTNNSYLSIKDSSTALYQHFKSPVTIISAKQMECNNNEYKVENHYTIRKFVSDKFVENKSRFISIDNINEYIEHINIPLVVANENSRDIIIKNIHNISSLNDNIIDYLEPEDKHNYIKTFLQKNINYLKNLKNLSLNKIKILPSLRESVERNGWPEQMNTLIDQIFTYEYERANDYRIRTSRSHYSIPSKDVEVIKHDINFNKSDNEIIEQIANLFSNDTISILNIFKSINNFKIGDKVVCINRGSVFYNVQGIIKEFINNEPKIGIAFKENKGGHNLNNSGKPKTRQGYGYYMYQTEVRTLDIYVDTDYYKFFSLLSNENKLKYIKNEVIQYITHEDIKKFDKESQLEMLYLDIKNLPDRFDHNKILNILNNMSEYEMINSNKFYFIKEKTPNL